MFNTIYEYSAGFLGQKPRPRQTFIRAEDSGEIVNDFAHSSALASLDSDSLTAGNDEPAIIGVSTTEHGEELVCANQGDGAGQQESLALVDKWIQECRV